MLNKFANDIELTTEMFLLDVYYGYLLKMDTIYSSVVTNGLSDILFYCK